MANTINAYDADVRIPQFLGLRQYGDTINGNPVYAENAMNMNTKGGTLMPMAAPVPMDGALPEPIETLMMVNSRWGEHAGVLLVAAAGGRIYTRGEDDTEWIQADMPEGLTIFASNEWSWVDYEINTDNGDTHDVILFTNAYDGLFMLDGTERTITPVETPYLFGIIERRSERIWGAACKRYDEEHGQWVDEPDLLVYSAPYNPKDWAMREPDATEDPDDPRYNPRVVPGQPEDGAGEIREPSWDGDKFVALRAFGDQLIAFKRTRVWRVLGTNPGEYEFKEQYGGGAYAPQTVAVDANRIYMLGRDGVYSFDGNSVEPFGAEYAHRVWKKLNLQFSDEACACVWREKYYIAIPTDGPSNDLVVTYDLRDGTWLVRDDLRIESWLPGEDALYFTTADDPFTAYTYQEDAWESGSAIAGDQYWESPWNDLGYPHKTKGPFKFYFTPEVQGPADFVITIATEKKGRSKEVRAYPLLGYEQRMNYEAKTIRVPFAVHGRRFRLKIQAKGGAVWRIRGGVLLNCDQETDEDL